MDYVSQLNLHQVILGIQHLISLAGILIIMSGVFVAIGQYLVIVVNGDLLKQSDKLNTVRLNLGRILVLGLEFIVASDLIGTTTTPDYYALGLAAIIVLIRTLLSFSLNRELMSLSRR